jgi:hypothetical protein
VNNVFFFLLLFFSFASSLLCVFHKIDAFILSRSESELSEIYQILMENLYNVSSALSAMEIALKANHSGTTTSSSTTTAVSTGTRDTVDIITTL